MLIITVALASGGCASNAAMAPKAAPEGAGALVSSSPSRVVRYEPSSSGSLVFDPPVTIGQPRLELSRRDRAPDAFVGFQTLTTTYFHIRTDDHQRDGRFNRFQRRAVSERVGVTYR